MILRRLAASFVRSLWPASRQAGRDKMFDRRAAGQTHYAGAQILAASDSANLPPTPGQSPSEEIPPATEVAQTGPAESDRSTLPAVVPMNPAQSLS